MARKLPYKEGDWFAVPLRDGGFALGVVARMDGKGAVIAYLFGPRSEALPSLEAVGSKRATDAVLARISHRTRFCGRWGGCGGVGV